MNKNKKLNILIAAACILSASTAFAGPGKNYVKVSGKYSMMGDMDVTNMAQVDSDDGYGFGLAIGTHMEMFKIEAEIATQKNDINAIEIGARDGRYADSGDTRIDTAMINAFIDVPMANGFSFYAGGGLGGAIVTYSLYNVDDNATVFAYKFGAGIGYDFTSEMGAELGYEYLATDDVSLDGIEVKDIASNNIVLSFKYMF